MTIKKFLSAVFPITPMHKWTQWKTSEVVNNFLSTARVQRRTCITCGLTQEIGLEPSGRPCNEAVMEIAKEKEGIET